MPTENIRFKGHLGDELAARMELPTGEIKATAIFAHCFSCSKDVHASRRIASRLATLGIAVMRFDFTGLGNSGGDFANTNFTSNIGDLVLAANFLEEKYKAPSLLIGHSLGGAAVIRAAKQIPSVKAIATIGAPANPDHVSHNFGASVEEIKEKGEAEVNLGGRPFKIKKQFLDDIMGHQIEEALKGLKAAILVMHSPVDAVVGVENASEIFLAAKHPKSFVSLDKADHLVTREEDSCYIANLISSWATRYLDLPEDAEIPGAPEGVVRVQEANPKGLTQYVTVHGEHQLIADEPKELGGLNLGPTPFQFLSVGLGACTTMTLRLYARRKKLPLESVWCDVTHNKVHNPEDEAGGKIDKFVRSITIVGDELTQEQRQRLLEIADRCPVHRTLHSDVVIDTVLAE